MVQQLGEIEVAKYRPDRVGSRLRHLGAIGSLQTAFPSWNPCTLWKPYQQNPGSEFHLLDCPHSK